MKTVSELTDFYYNDLYPQLQELEDARKALKNKVIITASTLIAISMPLFYFLTNRFQFLNINTAIAYMSVMSIVGGIIYKTMIQGYTTAFKFKVIAPIIQAIDKELRYAPKHSVTQARFDRSKLFTQKIDKFDGNDYVAGTIDEVKIEFSDIHAQKKSRDAKGRTHWQTIFQGLFIVTSFNKNFSGSTIVLPDNAENIFGSLVGNWLQANSLGKGQLIKMDDPRFEKAFVVYGSDQIESRYILTHAMMQRLLELKKKTGKELYASFVGGQMYLAITYNKDLFEPSLFRSLLSYKISMEYIKTLHLAITITKELKLNQKLWSKR